MTSVGDESAAQCEQLFAAFLERYHDHGSDPEALFLAHPEHAPTLRRWWRRLAAAGEVQPVPRGERFGHFVLLEELGAGAQGRVHLALDPRLGRHVALKLLPAMYAVHGAALERFRREAAVAARLQHPGICTVYEAGEHDGIAYIAMQYVHGETLADRLAVAREHGLPLPIDEALAIVEAAADALHTAHEAGLVHRDVKPGNLMIGRDGRPVVLDFGLASDSQSESDLTRTGDLLGTPSYMSPEQIHGGCGALDRRTDVWSLGIVLYECLTLRPPFDGPTQQQLQQRILTAPLPDPRRRRPGLSRETVTVLATALAKDRSHRYASAGDLAEDLRRLRLRESVLAQAIGPMRQLWRWSRTRPVLATSLAAVAVATLAATAIISLLYLEAEAARRSFGQLADADRLWIAEAEAARLYPVTPALAPRLTRWLDEHVRLAARIDLHREALAELRRIGRPRGITDERDLEQHPAMPRVLELRRLRDEWEDMTARRRELSRALGGARAAAVAAELEALEAIVSTHRVLEFDDAEDRSRHRQLSLLVPGLEHFVSAAGAIADIEARLVFARTVESRTIDACAEAWRSAAETVARDPRFGGRTLTPQLGLVPLGPDPRSGLEEFALLFAHGGTVPVRDPTSRELELDAASVPVLVLVPPGRFAMGARNEPGSPDHDELAGSDATPPIEVLLDWFFIGKHELSWGQWHRLARDPDVDVAAAIAATTEPDIDPELRPVTDVSWLRCVEVLARHELLLPTEAQWEYATRAGSTTMYWTGAHWSSLSGAVNFRGDEGGPGSTSTSIDDQYRFAAPIHALRGNGFGLHNTAGNVVEWCRDCYSRSAYRSFPPRPGDGLMETPNANLRSVRGGSFMTTAPAGRSAARNARPQNRRHADVGLRIVRAVRP